MNLAIAVVLGVVWLGALAYFVWDLVKVFRTTRTVKPNNDLFRIK